MKIRKCIKTAMEQLQIKKLRPNQLKPINRVLDGKDTLLIAATSFGKSLIAQIPAVVHHDKLTIIIEPLTALMHEQAERLQELGIPAAYLDSTQTSQEQKAVREGENKARNCKTANDRSYKQKCKTAAFFAYDKTAQLKMIDKFPDRLIGKKVLRIEGQFRPKALKKWASGDNNWQIVKDTYKNASKILNWYIDRVQPKGDIPRYKDAVNTINSAKMKDKTRDRMLYLLRKTSDKDSLSAALKALEEKYRLSKGQCNTILRKFRQLGISPITLPNSSKFEMLPGLREYISKNHQTK